MQTNYDSNHLNSFASSNDSSLDANNNQVTPASTPTPLEANTASSNNIVTCNTLSGNENALNCPQRQRQPQAQPSVVVVPQLNNLPREQVFNSPCITTGPSATATAPSATWPSVNSVPNYNSPHHYTHNTHIHPGRLHQQTNETFNVTSVYECNELDHNSNSTSQLVTNTSRVRSRSISGSSRRSNQPPNTLLHRQTSDMNILQMVPIITSGASENTSASVVNVSSVNSCNTLALSPNGPILMNSMVANPSTPGGSASTSGGGNGGGGNNSGSGGGGAGGSNSSERSVRLARNVAEKQRRDKLNAYISDLANSVPLIATATKRLDKTSILRLSAAYLRLHESPLAALAQNPSAFTQLNTDSLVHSPHKHPISIASSPCSSSCTSDSSQLQSQLSYESPGTNGTCTSLSPSLPFVPDERHSQNSPKATSVSPSNSISRWKPSFFSTNHLKSLMESVDGFLIVLNSDLKLIYVSQTCEKFLGHANIDMMGFQLGHFIHPGDCEAVSEILEETKKNLSQSDQIVSDRIQFRCRMRERSQPRTEMVTYQMVSIAGVFEICLQDPSLPPGMVKCELGENVPQNCNSPTTTATSSAAASATTVATASSATTNRSESTCYIGRKRKIDQVDQTSDSVNEWHEASSQGNSSTILRCRKTRPSHSPPPIKNRFSNAFLSRNLLFKGFVQVIASSPTAELSLIDANQEEYVTRMTLDGVFLYADHRLSMVTGYTPSEILGKSAYAYILVPDHVISLFAHKLMLSNSNGTGIVVHRLRQRTGTYVYIQSAGCLQYDRSTGQVDHFVCVSRLLRDDEGDKERQKFVRKFTPHVTDDSPSALYESLQLVIGPRSSRAVNYQSCVTSFNSIPVPEDAKAASSTNGGSNGGGGVIITEIKSDQECNSTVESSNNSPSYTISKSANLGGDGNVSMVEACSSSSYVPNEVSLTCKRSVTSANLLDDGISMSVMPMSVSPIKESKNVSSSLEQVSNTTISSTPTPSISVTYDESQRVIGQSTSPPTIPATVEEISSSLSTLPPPPPATTKVEPSSPHNERDSSKGAPMMNFSTSSSSTPSTCTSPSASTATCTSTASASLSISPSATPSNTATAFNVSNQSNVNQSNVNLVNLNKSTVPRQVRHSDTSQLPLIASGKSFNLNNPSYGSNTHRVYVNLPPDASFIREDGSFIDTSSVISIDSLPQAALNAPRGSIQNQTAVHQSTAFAPAPVPAAGQLGQGLSSQISNVMNDSTVTTISPAFHEQNHPSVHLQGQEGQLGRMTDEGPFIQAALHTDHQTFNEPPPPPSSRSNNPSVPCNLNDLKNLLDPTQTTLLNQLRKHATSERFVPFSKNSIAGRNVNQQAQQQQQQQQQQLQQLQLQVQLQQQQAQQQLVTIDHLTQQPLVRHLSSGDFSSGGFNVTNTGAFVTDESAHYDLNQATQSVGQVVFSAERLMTESASSMAGAVVFSFGDEPSPHTFPSQQDAECTINPFDSFVHHHHPHHHHHLQQQQQQQLQQQLQQQQQQLQLQQPPQNPYQE